MIVQLLTEHHLECLSLKGCCTGSSESILGKLPHYLKSHAMAHRAQTNPQHCQEETKIIKSKSKKTKTDCSRSNKSHKKKKNFINLVIGQ